MDVSVIVPIHNGADHLDALLRALAAQTYRAGAVEVVCVDNNSTDDTAAILRCWTGPRVRVLSCARQGSYAARNVGIAAAQGPLLAFTDADCLPRPGWLEAAVACLQASGADRVAGEIHIPVSARAPIWALLDASYYLRQELAVRQGWSATANLLARRTAIERAGAFADRLISWGDIEFGQRCTRAGCSIVYCPEAVVVHAPRSSARAIVRRSIRIGLGQAQIAHHRLATHDRAWYRVVRRRLARGVPERRLPAPALPPLRRLQLQALRVVVGDLPQIGAYLWGRFALRRPDAERLLEGAARAERSAASRPPC